MDDLFEVFNEDAERSVQAVRETFNCKRHANGNIKKDNVCDNIMSEDGEVSETTQEVTNGQVIIEDSSTQCNKIYEESKEDGHELKRARVEVKKFPVLRDGFATEQSREVASSAGLMPRQDNTAMILSHQVRHNVALPPNYDYVLISEHKSPERPARVWPFKLDPFQQVSIASIERNESVLVSAHTSAGKTVVAEYAIAQCLQNNQRVIYTSPIKALSNQKYREFAAEFQDVGLMTGDVTINPTATCLVMTTEILRSMLYRGSEIMREVAWVIFDEVHYMRDKSRGVVWEEAIILLPDKVRYVFLSATIPNAMQFAEWITKIHDQPCHVVYTDFRPTPLQHYLFPAGADGIHLVVDEKGVFREENFFKAMASISPESEKKKLLGRAERDKLMQTGKKGNSPPSDIYKILKMIMMKNYNPVIVFSFSKRECEDFALQMSQLAFNDESEKAMVGKVFNSAIDMLSEQDRNLPQIQHILPLLRRGIGIHHSGLLPLLKETIEILFQEGLIKVLFATETFSIGLNMPAKTVVFTSVRKFDGVEVRWVTPSEFIQMSGRAGRRGLDERGIVIMMIDEKMEPATAREIVRGEQDKLISAFHLGYNMILNLMRVEGISPEYMLERCFYQFQNTACVADLEAELTRLEEEKAVMHINREVLIREYYDIRQQLRQLEEDVRVVITHPSNSLRFLQPGRLIRVKRKDEDYGWGAVVNFVARRPGKNQAVTSFEPHQSYIVDVLLQVASDTQISGCTSTMVDLPMGVRPPEEGDPGRPEVVPILLSCIDALSHVRVIIPSDLRSIEHRRNARKIIDEVKRRFPDGIALLDPIENMEIKDGSFKRLLRKIELLENKLYSNELRGTEELAELYDKYAAKVELTNRIREVRKKITDALSIIQLDELKSRKRVLRRLGFTNEADIVELKARVACEISTGDELVISELLFNRFFNELSTEQCAACLSCFIMEEQSKDQAELREELAKPYREILAQARIIAKVSQECKLAVDEGEYLQGFKHHLMEVVYAWMKGATFAEICKMTDVYEGSLIRLFRRLEELLRQVSQAAKVMGSEDLEKKFDEALVKVKRDIVATQSLYL